MPTVLCKNRLKKSRGENRTQKTVTNKALRAYRFCFKQDGAVAAFFYSLQTADIFFMRSILYTIAIICIVGWLLGVFVWSATGLIHLLIVLAVISLLLGIIRRA